MYNLICLDFAEENTLELQNMSLLFDAELYLYNSIADVEEKVSNCNTPVILAIDIEKDVEKKYKLTSKLKERYDTTIIYITSDCSPESRVRCLSLGATTYIKKPYKPEELLRYAYYFSNISSGHSLRDKYLRIDLIARTVYYEGTIIELSPRPFDLLVYLVQNEGKIVTREEIMKEVFRKDQYLSVRNIDTIIKTLRKKTHKELISSIRGVGYRYQSNS